MPIINRVHNLIERVKKRILGNQTEKEINERRMHLKSTFEQTKANFKEISLRETNRFFDALYDDGYFLNDGMLVLIENTIQFLVKIDKLLIDGRKQVSPNLFGNLVSIVL